MPRLFKVVILALAIATVLTLFFLSSHNEAPLNESDAFRMRDPDEYQRQLLANALRSSRKGFQGHTEVKSDVLIEQQTKQNVRQKIKQDNVNAKAASEAKETIKPLKSSDLWAPMIIDKCYASFPHSGPCLLESNPDTSFKSAQELIYPAFKLKAPIFIDAAQRLIWIGLVEDLSRMRLSNDKTFAEYPTFFGQNLVFNNIMFESRTPNDAWSEQACMSGDFSHSQFITQNTVPFNPPANEIVLPSITIATSPDSWSFQHFLDRVTVVWSQALLSTSVSSKTIVITGGDRRSGFVDELFMKMGVERHQHYIGPIYANEAVVSCRAPLVHPYTMQRVSELFGVDLAPSSVPKERKVVLYLTRNNGDTANAGRLILNEEELLDGIEELLKKRGKGEELVIFDRKSYKSLEELVDYFDKNVLAMIGAHGSAFHNARFARKNTLIVEFMPISRFQVCFWEQARLMEQNYITLMLKSENGANDMTVDRVDKLMALIDVNLGLTGNDYATKTYPWNTAS